MSDPDPKPPSLDDLGAKLAAIRKRRTPPKRTGGGRMQGSELAWRMVIDLTAGMVVGLAIGWGLDGLLGTRPLFMIVFVLLGFAAGVRVMMQSAKGGRRGAAPEAAATEDDKAAASARDTKAAASARDTKAAVSARDTKAAASARDTKAAASADADKGAAATAPPKDEGR